jgi:CheY-like chemotaxis protein
VIELRILIIEDEQAWGAVMADLLSPLGGQSEVAPDHESARGLIQRVQYDLVITDLALPGGSASASTDVGQGFELLRELRDSTLNETSAVLVVSGQMRNNDVSEAMRRYKVHHFFDKLEFDDSLFVSKAADALLLSRIKRANRKYDRGSRLRVYFDKDRIVGSILEGFIQRPFQSAPSSASLDVADLVRRTNNMNRLVQDGPEVWRPEAKSLGKDLYKILYSDRSIVEGLAAATNPRDLWLQFSGPPQGLGVPFELLHDGDDYMTFKHVLTRGVQRRTNSIKRANFQEFIRSFLGGHVPLRILIPSCAKKRVPLFD